VKGLVEQIGSTRVLFSSRTPILYAEASKDMIQQSEITTEDKANILGRNAARLLKLPT
jgi:predicted TIM-barrel fold metal-dependent hydrolase